ncbi:MAG: hypothetical protein PHV00_11510 [Syntrophales bacterium]|jgi:hypothetical protein|nr:hypothetical protein [Syntrophales bacterium]
MRLLPSVTEVIAPWVDFSGIPPGVLNHASERGTEVHRVCLDLYARGLPVIGIDGEVRGYLDSFRRWLDKMADQALLIEERLFDQAHGYSGQLDLIVWTRPEYGSETWLVDLKTPLALSKSWRVQISAYRSLAISQRGITPEHCGSLRLDPNGGAAKVDWYDGSADRDFSVFLSCLNAYRFFKQI